MRSRSLETKLRLNIGRNEFKSVGLRLDFLRSDRTMLLLVVVVLLLLAVVEVEVEKEDAFDWPQCIMLSYNYVHCANIWLYTFLVHVMVSNTCFSNRQTLTRSSFS